MAEEHLLALYICLVKGYVECQFDIKIDVQEKKTRNLVRIRLL